jgi:hypothetical protein
MKELRDSNPDLGPAQESGLVNLVIRFAEDVRRDQISRPD